MWGPLPSDVWAHILHELTSTIRLGKVVHANKGLVSRLYSSITVSIREGAHGGLTLLVICVGKAHLNNIPEVGESSAGGVTHN